jgi:hypothetical protein
MTNPLRVRLRRACALLLLCLASLPLPACGGSGAITGAAIGAAFGAAIGSGFDDCDPYDPYDDCYYYKAGDPALDGTF